MRTLLVGNWKMNLDHLQAIQLVQQLSYHLDPEDYEANEIVVAPPFTALRSVQTLIDGDRLPIGLAAQNCHLESSGAYTGEVSPVMVAKLKCSYVICGHSERRALFGETDQVVARKVRSVLDHGMRPILCVGETLEDHDAGEAEKVVTGQLQASLEGVDADDIGKVVVAYEPVWAIGTGRTATPADANTMCDVVRGTVADRFVPAAGESLQVLYGGSVKPGNVAELMRQPQINGALVGGASVDADDFAVICRHHRL